MALEWSYETDPLVEEASIAISLGAWIDCTMLEACDASAPHVGNTKARKHWSTDGARSLPSLEVTASVREDHQLTWMSAEKPTSRGRRT